MKRVSVINFKGGVGKTTLSLHLAAFLAREHRVLMIDVDHQSSLSIVILVARFGGNALRIKDPSTGYLSRSAIAKSLCLKQKSS
jgi:cellulose biosynthesis protein BcsQ